MSGKYKLEGKNVIIAVNMLETVTKIFEDVELKYVLDCGTLLGIYREDRLLPWDNDMDLSIFCDDEKRIKNVIKKIKKAGYIVKIRYQEKEDYPLEFKKIRILKIYNRKNFFAKGEVMLDCFMVKRGDNQYVCAYGGLNHYTKIHIPTRFYETVDHLNFKGKQYSIPSYIEEYLTHRYGNWKIPIRDGSWDYRKDDGSIVFSQIKNNEKTAGPT